MDAGTRADLEKNSLATALMGAPAWLKENGTRLLLIVVLCVLVFWAVRNWRAGQAQAEVNRVVNQQNARAAVRQLRTLPPALPAETLADQRDQLTEQAEAAIGNLLEDGDRKAAALVSRGDLYWTLANLPVPAEATTRPALAPATDRQASLENAVLAYTEAARLAEDADDRVEARFGLAVVSEELGEFAEARTQYEAIANDEDAGDLPRTVARRALAQLDGLENAPAPLPPAPIEDVAE